MDSLAVCIDLIEGEDMSVKGTMGCCVEVMTLKRGRGSDGAAKESGGNTIFFYA
jgi:hypothetical protein